MKILIACEYSGTVRDAFIAKGHNAVSCDLLPTESPGPHYQGSVFDIIGEGYDMMIAHPPCQYLTWAGIGYFNVEKYGDKAIERSRLREESMSFFMALYNAPIPKICIENPRGYPGNYIKPSQTIHPFYFGEEHKKMTCFWLKGLPLLRHFKQDDLFDKRTHSDEPQPLSIDYTGKKRYFVDSKIRNAKDRAKFWPLVAKAMADQWG
jgi:glycosyltransferase involved in cell wall biosynthesis